MSAVVLRTAASSICRRLVVAFTGVAALASCGGGSSSPPASQPTQPPAVSGHLYVATSTGEVLRYPIVRGTPASASDLTLQGAGPPIFVAPSGNIYARSLTNPAEILAFASGSAKPSRSVVLQPPSASSAGLSIDAIAVDSKGFLYAALMYSDSSLTHEDVWTIAPNAARKMVPIAELNLLVYPSYNIPLEGLTVGGGLVYVSVTPIFEGQNTTGYVQILTAPFLHPQSGNVIGGGALTQPLGLAFDAGGALYVVNGPSVITFRGTPEVLVYAPPSNTPLRSIAPLNGSVRGTPAVSAGVLFVPGTNVVYELNAAVAGTQTPIATLNVNGAVAVALGP